MDILEYFYNQGEFYNLLVLCGILIVEDCFKINEYMIGIIKLFDNFFFFLELVNVFCYVFIYYEMLIGIGYLCCLSVEDLFILEWIIVIVDIFEVLIVVDWFYKVVKFISEVVDILFCMVVKGNIDWDVFNLFLGSGVYKKYV